jgi:hypothetical protein
MGGLRRPFTFVRAKHTVGSTIESPGIALTLAGWLLEMSEKVPCRAVFWAGPARQGAAPRDGGPASDRTAAAPMRGRRAASWGGPAPLSAALARGALVGRSHIDGNGSHCGLDTGHHVPMHKCSDHATPPPRSSPVREYTPPILVRQENKHSRIPKATRFLHSLHHLSLGSGGREKN